MKSLVGILAALFIATSAHAQLVLPGAGGSGGGSGTVTSVATACGASGGPITTSGTISASLLDRVNTATSGVGANFVATDCGGVVYDNSASSVAISLPAPSTTGFGNGAFFERCNINTGVATITPVSGTIGGGSTYAIAAGTAAAPTCVAFQSDGTNYNLVQIPSGSGTVTSVSVATANGVSGSVATPTSTPAITLTLGAITPTTVNGNTVPTATDTVGLLAATQSFTNKTITSSTNSLGGVTAAFGSDAKGDIYTNGGSSNVITRLAIGTTGQCLVVASGLPSWGSCGSGSGNALFGTTTGNVANDIVTMSNTTVGVQDSGVAISSLAPKASPTFTGTVTMPDSSTHTSGGLTGLALATVTGTTAPTMAAGTLALGGLITAPTFGANDEGAVYLSSTLGLVLQGQGSSDSVTLLASGGSNKCAMSAGAGFTCTGAGSFSSVSAATTSNAANVVGTFANLSTGSSATVIAEFENGNATPVQATMTLNGSATTSGNGVNSFTINGVTSLFLQGGGVNAIGISGAGALSFPNLTQSAAAQSGTICFNTTGNLVTYDATLGCLTSSARFKTAIKVISPSDALATVLKLEPVSFRKKPEFGGADDPATQVGFIAEQVAGVDERLTAREGDGEVRGVRYQQLTAILAGAIQELKADNDNLRIEIEGLRHLR
jgi:hypothetical protein